MAREIERRFLLSAPPVFPEPIKSRPISQGYFELNNSTDSIRVRIYTDTDKAYITSKQGTGIIREETPEKPPFEIDPMLARMMLGLAHHNIKKLRFLYQGWEIDIFGGPLAGVFFAEKELASPDEMLNIPDWLSLYIVKEVTDSLSNLHLARLATDLKGSKLLASPFITDLLGELPKKIVITGPPCSGKTTVMNKLKKIFPKFHFVPEVATIVISQLGLRPGKNNLEILRFQKTIYRTQRIFEDSSMQFAVSENKNAIILDRGTADQIAYMPGGITQFAEVIGVDPSYEYGRYDAVIFLELPSREVYGQNSHNNSARMEKYDEATSLAARLYDAWSDHSRFYTIEATKTWEEKERKIINCLNLALN